MTLAIPVAVINHVSFGALCVSLISSKFLLLRTHFITVPLASFFLYLPTMVMSDVVTIAIGRLLLPQRTKTAANVGRGVVAFAS
jgi:hypothetical protein